MVVLNVKTFKELYDKGIEKLQNVGFSTSPGSIAKLFLNIVNYNIANLYATLTIYHLRAFVTTADSDALDSIGLLLQCYRLPAETDDNYRYRITQQCLVLATSNETAIRLTALTVDGVQDVVLKPYSMGAGSFTVICITDSNLVSDDILDAVTEKLITVHGYGIRYNVTTPTLTYVTIKQRLYMDSTTSDSEKQEIRYAVQQAILEYFSNLKIGQNIITDQITQAIMNTDSRIIEEVNEGFTINGERAMYTDQSCRWFERFVISTDVDNVVVL